LFKFFFNYKKQFSLFLLGFLLTTKMFVKIVLAAGVDALGQDNDAEVETMRTQAVEKELETQRLATGYLDQHPTAETQRLREGEQQPATQVQHLKATQFLDQHPTAPAQRPPTQKESGPVMPTVAGVGITAAAAFEKAFSAVRERIRKDHPGLNQSEVSDAARSIKNVLSHHCPHHEPIYQDGEELQTHLLDVKKNQRAQAVAALNDAFNKYEHAHILRNRTKIRTRLDRNFKIYLDGIANFNKWKKEWDANPEEQGRTTTRLGKTLALLKKITAYFAALPETFEEFKNSDRATTLAKKFQDFDFLKMMDQFILRKKANRMTLEVAEKKFSKFRVLIATMIYAYRIFSQEDVEDEEMNFSSTEIYVMGENHHAAPAEASRFLFEALGASRSVENWEETAIRQEDSAGLRALRMLESPKTRTDAWAEFGIKKFDEFSSRIYFSALDRAVMALHETFRENEVAMRNHQWVHRILKVRGPYGIFSNDVPIVITMGRNHVEHFIASLTPFADLIGKIVKVGVFQTQTDIDIDLRRKERVSQDWPYFASGEDLISGLNKLKTMAKESESSAHEVLLRLHKSHFGRLLSTMPHVEGKFEKPHVEGCFNGLIQTEMEKFGRSRDKHLNKLLERLEFAEPSSEDGGEMDGGDDIGQVFGGLPNRTVSEIRTALQGCTSNSRTSLLKFWSPFAPYVEARKKKESTLGPKIDSIFVKAGGKEANNIGWMVRDSLGANRKYAQLVRRIIQGDNTEDLYTEKSHVWLNVLKITYCRALQSGKVKTGTQRYETCKANWPEAALGDMLAGKNGELFDQAIADGLLDPSSGS
jgi:hypothetical protein